MQSSTFRDLVRERHLKVGTAFLEFDSPGIGDIAKAAGLDFAFFDMEHSGFDVETCKRALKYMQAADLPTLVRPPSQTYHHIARVLDIGAEALLLPMTESVEQVHSILRAMKYPPDGGRGVALGIGHDRYRPGPAGEKLAAANERNVFVPLIETRDAIANIDAIAATDGVDALWIGHYDLSTSLGIPGAFEHPDFTAAVAKVVQAARANGKTCGRMVATVAEGIALNRQGFDMICYSGDCFLLREALSQGAAQIREGAG